MGNTQSPEKRDAELNSAAEEGRADVVEDLIKKGANPNRRSTIKSDRQRTPLHRAAMTKNNTNVLTKLLDHIQDVGMSNILYLAQVPTHLRTCWPGLCQRRLTDICAKGRVIFMTCIV